MKTVFLLGGKIGSGKNFVFDILTKALQSEGKTCEHVYFAKALKDMSKESFKPLAAHINHICENIELLLGALEDTPVNLIIKNGIYDNLKLLKIKDENWYENKTEITRMIIQVIGTDFVRLADKDFWVKQAAKVIQSSTADYFIITDFRFPNEYYSLKDMIPGAKIVPVKIDRTIEREGVIHQHPSELALDDFKHFEETIDNNGTLEETEKNVKEMVSKYV